MFFLKQSTSVKVVAGPFVLPADAVTMVSGLALATAQEAGVMKHDAASVLDVTGNTFAEITDNAGYYNFTFETGDLDTLGLLKLTFNDPAAYLPVAHDYMVVPANIWDSWFAADVQDVNTVEINGDAIAAVNLAAHARIVVPVTFLNGGTTTVAIIDQIDGTDVDDTVEFYVGRLLVFNSGTLRLCVAEILDYSGTGNEFTITQIPFAVTSAHTALLV